MGAIFGHLGPCPSDTAPRMADLLRHRAPHRFIKTLPNGVVGVLTHDEAPAFAESESVSLVAHGTEYAQTSNSIAATLLEAWQQRTLNSLNADYAFAAIDHAGRLILSRDYFGMAPLHFAATSTGIAFASEYKALLPFAKSVQPDLDMVQHVQYAKRLPPGRTLLRGVRAVLPGQTLTITAGGTESATTMPPLTTTGSVTDIEQAKSLILSGLTSALERRVAGLERIGLALSGGIDSIALAFLLHQIAPETPLVTVCVGSSVNDHECVTARSVAQAVGSEHHEVILPPGELSVEALRTLAWHQEDPLSRSESLQLYEVGRAAAAAGCKVVLSAQGADGLFAGMPKFQLMRLMQKYPILRRGLEEFYFYTQIGTPPTGLLGRLGVLAKFRGKLPRVPTITGTTYSPVKPTFPAPGPQLLNRSMAGGFQAGVCQDIPKFERTFAAHGLEYRTPFYDREFVNLSFTIDDALKLRNGQEKWILRQACAGVVPEQYLNIPKFPQRIDADLQFAAALDAIVDHPDVRPKLDELFDPGSIESLLRKDNTPYIYEAAMRIWTAVLTALWAEHFASNPARLEPAHG